MVHSTTKKQAQQVKKSSSPPTTAKQPPAAQLQQTVQPGVTAMKPADGQILGDINEALDAVVDLKGEKIEFKRNEDIKDDIVYSGEGSDGRTYNLQLQKKSVIVSVYNTPKPEEVGKAPKSTSKKASPQASTTQPAATIEKKQEGREEQEQQQQENNNTSDMKKDLDRVVDELDKPILEKENKKV